MAWFIGLLFLASAVNSGPINKHDRQKASQQITVDESPITAERLKQTNDTSFRSTSEIDRISNQSLRSLGAGDTPLDEHTPFDDAHDKDVKLARRLRHKRSYYRSRCCYIDVLCSRGCRRGRRWMLSRGKRVPQADLWTQQKDLLDAIRDSLILPDRSSRFKDYLKLKE